MTKTRSYVAAGLLSSGFAAALGCNAILGNDVGVLRPDGGHVVAPPHGDAALTCGPGQKLCPAFNTCLPAGQTASGCGDPTSCEACSVPHGTPACAPGDAGFVACTLEQCNDPRFADCNHDPSDGCEADLSNPANCGGCGRPCPGALPKCAQLASGIYGCVGTCPLGFTDCGSCTDLMTDPANCGGCMRSCGASSNATSVCTSGQCGIACGAGYHLCKSAKGDARCVSDNSLTYCGASCSTCQAPANTTGAVCAKGSCGYASCSPGYLDCDKDPSNGCEASSSSNEHCGSCNVNCNRAGTGMACCNGKCQPMANGCPLAQ